MNELKEQLNYYGFDLLDYQGKPGYEQRKSGAWAVVDRRNGRVCCVYSTKDQIKKWLDKEVNHST